MDNIVNKIKNLEQEDLEFYKKLISFFETIGISTEDLNNLVNLTKVYPEFIQKINAVINDQKIINEKYDNFIKTGNQKEVTSNPLSSFNKESKKLKPYGDRE